MSRFRVVFIVMMVASSLLVLGVPTVDAQRPTEIAIPTATAEGCDRVPAYLEVRRTIMNEFLKELETVFPQVATPVMENGDQLFTAIMSMTPAQSLLLAKAYDTVADKIEKIAAPDVAVFYNGLQVQLYRLSADVFKEAGKTDLNAAGEKFNEQLVAIGEAVGLAGAAATGACPAFGEVVILDQTQAAM